MSRDIKKRILLVFVILFCSHNLLAKQCLWRDIECDTLCDDDYDSEEELCDHVKTHVKSNHKVIKCYWARVHRNVESHCGRLYRSREFDEHIEKHVRRYFDEQVTNKSKKSFEEYYEQEQDQEQNQEDITEVSDEQDAQVNQQEQAEKETQTVDAVETSPKNIVVERKKKILKRINHDGLPFLCHYPGEEGYICGRSFQTLDDLDSHQKKHKRAIRDAGRTGKEREDVKELVWLD